MENGRNFHRRMTHTMNELMAKQQQQQRVKHDRNVA